MSLFRRSKSKDSIKQKDKPQDHAQEPTPVPAFPHHNGFLTAGGPKVDDMGRRRERDSAIKTAPVGRRKEKPENLRDRVISQP